MTSFGRRPSSAAERWRCAALALVLVLGSSAGCARSDTTPVARGEYYAAGHPDYDEFFVRLYRHQVDATEAARAEQAAHAELTSWLGAAAEEAELEPRLARRATELRERGLRLELVLGKPPAKAAVLNVHGKPEEAEKARTDVLKGAVVQLAETERKARASVEEIDRLRLQALELEREADRAFWKEGAAKRTEVKQNLRDARKLLVLMSDRQRAIAESSGASLEKVARAFPEQPKAPPRAVAGRRSTPKAGKKKGSGPRKARPAARKASPKPAPAQPAKPAAPAPKTEFEP